MHKLQVSRRGYIGLSTLFFFICLASWSLSGPISSAPDSDFHMSSIWCAWGEEQGICENATMTSTGPVVDVPFFVQMCEGRPITSWNNCEPNETHEKMQTLRTSTDSVKNLYYVLMRAIASPNVPLSIITIRLISCLIASFLMFGVLSLATSRLLIGAICSLVFILVPNVLLLIPMATSKSWALIGSLFGWVFLAVAIDRDRVFRDRLWASILFGCCAFLVASTRIDATTFLLFSSALIVLRRTELRLIYQSKRRVLTLAALVIALFLLIRTPRINGYVSSLKLQKNGSLMDTFFFIVNQIFETLASSFGYSVPQSGAGPGIVGIIGVGLAALVLGVSLQKQTRSQLLQTAWVVIFLIFIVYYGNVTMGPRVPGTYILSITSLLIGISVFNAHSGPYFLANKKGRLFVLMLIAFSHLLTLRGRTYGYVMSSPQIEIYMPWLNPLVTPGLIVASGVISFFVFLILVMKVIDLDSSEEIHKRQIS